MPFGRKSPLEALAFPGVILAYKYSQYRQRRREAASRRVTERELSALHHKIINWYDALDICAFHGGILLTIQNDDEMKAFSDFLLESPLLRSGKFWLGIKNVGLGAQSAFTSTGEEVLYRKWAINEFDPKNNRISCIHIAADNTTFAMFNSNCMFKNSYICRMGKVQKEEPLKNNLYKKENKTKNIMPTKRVKKVLKDSDEDKNLISYLSNLAE